MSEALIARKRQVLASLKDQRAVLQREIDIVERELSEALSRQWIEVNRVTRDRVHVISSGATNGDAPYFGSVWQFAEWLKSHGTRPYAAWNTLIYLTSDLTAGRMPADMPGRLEHVR